MNPSSAPAVKKKLLELMEASSEFKGVQLCYGHPGPAIQQEVIYFHRTVETDRPSVLGDQTGSNAREENYSFDVIVEITQDGDRYDLAEERCWQVIAAIETVVRNNITMQEAVKGWVLYAGAEMVPFWSDSQTHAQATCRIEVTNRK